jgi:hypothetical protein
MDTLRTLFISFYVSTCISCNSDNRQTQLIEPIKEMTAVSNVDSTTKPAVELPFEKQQYVFLVAIYQRNDTLIIDADFVQYLWGQAAIDAAIKADEADTFKTADGKTYFAVPNDIFIVNESKKVRSLILDKNCVIDLIFNPDRQPPITDNSLSSLKNADKDNPFILTLNNENVVVGIKQVFVP